MPVQCNGPVRMESVVGDYLMIRTSVPFTGAVVELAKQAPDRQFLGIYFSQGSTCQIAPFRDDVVGAKGIPTGSTNPRLEWNARDHTAMVWSAWYASNAVGGSAYVIEIYYRPGG